MTFDINEKLRADDVSSQRGAPMGRRDYVQNAEATVYLQRVVFVDGDYDAGGAYWGGGMGHDLYCAMDDEGAVQVFARAKSRDEAKARISANWPGLKFHDGEDDVGLDDFTRHYIIAALWSSVDDDGEPLDGKYEESDIAPEALADMKADCKDFQESNAALLALAYQLYKPHADAPTPQCSAGHDFWLTRQRHGCGFWDRGFPHELGKVLTEAAQAYGEVDLYVGDDGTLYI